MACLAGFVKKLLRARSAQCLWGGPDIVRFVDDDGSVSDVAGLGALVDALSGEVAEAERVELDSSSYADKGKTFDYKSEYCGKSKFAACFRMV